MTEFGNLSQRVRELQGHGRLFLSFSTGVDSLACWLRCLEEGDWDPAEAVLFSYHFLPTSWYLDYVEYFEARYGVRIIRVPSHLYLEAMANWLYQTPSRAKAISELQKTPYAFRLLTRDQITYGCRVWSGLPESTLTAVGIKQGDSPMRRKQMRLCEGISAAQGKWYPVWDFETRDAVALVRRHGLKVPYDYALFGITFEQLDYRFSKVIHDRCPENWKMLLSHFPLAETILTRREHYRPDWGATKGVKLAQVRDMILPPRRPL